MKNTHADDPISVLVYAPAWQVTQAPVSARGAYFPFSQLVENIHELKNMHEVEIGPFYRPLLELH